ncbi:hypothetical protein EYR27_04900 [Xanthomonas oryzae]|nr:hypothetical protein EYR27_04900 [Xanthomonas oryzae]
MPQRFASQSIARGTGCTYHPRMALNAEDHALAAVLVAVFMQHATATFRHAPTHFGSLTSMEVSPACTQSSPAVSATPCPPAWRPANRRRTNACVSCSRCGCRR